MGTGYGFKCNKCGKEGYLNLGIGFGYSESCRQAKQAALNGELGEEWKKIVSEIPYSLVETKRYIIWCPNCHRFELAEDLSIYKPKNLEKLLKEQRGEKTVEEWGYDPWGVVKGEYELVKEFVYECEECKTKMIKVSEKDIKKIELICPKCGGKVELTDDILMWD